MPKVMFICHGNICRSTMAQSIFSHLVKEKNLQANFIIDSSGTSREEINNPPHPGTIDILFKNNIPLIAHRAKQITISEAQEFDYLICMDQNNIKNLKRIINQKDFDKISLLLSYANINSDIRDPWYTNNFEDTFEDIYIGCSSLIKFIIEANLLN